MSAQGKLSDLASTLELLASQARQATQFARARPSPLALLESTLRRIDDTRKVAGDLLADVIDEKERGAIARENG